MRRLVHPDQAQRLIKALLVLLFFLRNLRSVAIVSVSIPVSVVATFLLMELAGIDLGHMLEQSGARPVAEAVDYAIKNQPEAVKIVLKNDASGAQTEKHQARMMGEIAKLPASSPALKNILALKERVALVRKVAAAIERRRFEMHKTLADEVRKPPLATNRDDGQRVHLDGAVVHEVGGV